ncbi:MAG: helix-hairpin-helix domain-containing protein [candidate division NC10 bacterium]|nr:helix-hairpin-helix domain-containing protein [candidate division NC10 bacterium]MBI4840029.1 helix-hairpin-helix domain-containing protein [candidate division NC10 bacterium]
MSQAPGPGQPIRPASRGDVHGLAVLLLAAALAGGTTLHQLGPSGPGFPPAPEAEAGGRIAPRQATTGTRPAAPAGAPAPGRRGTPGGVPAKPLLVLPLDPNAADAEALQGLPGIGPTLAARIVADREAQGPFQRAEDLLRVPGIGPKRWERIRHAILVVAEGP